MSIILFMQEVIGAALDGITSYTELDNKEQVVALIDKVTIIYTMYTWAVYNI